MNLRQNVTTAVMTAVACFLLLPAAVADQVINDDLIVTGSECVGFDCVNGETFNADTIRLKENNLRIHFDDTSISGSFPRNDWRIVANDQANGGASYLGFEDSTAGRFPFRVEAGARANALYVESTGDVGIGTNNPVVELHVKSGNTPTLRLEQDGTSGFQAQTWDIAGNEANFFVRDVTSGSTLPFRIRPGAPTSAIDIANDGDVGIGTASPGARLHVKGSGSGIADVIIEDNSDTTANIAFQNSGSTGSDYWEFNTVEAATDHFLINKVGSGVQEFRLDQGGNLTLAGLCGASGGPPAADGCDGVFQPGYELESIEDHASAMWESSFLPAIGPTPDGKKVSLNIQQRHFGVLNELEKAHIYIDQLNERLKEKEASLEEMSARIARLESLVTSSK